jgi:hypothetical protein
VTEEAEVAHAALQRDDGLAQLVTQVLNQIENAARLTTRHSATLLDSLRPDGDISLPQ